MATHAPTATDGFFDDVRASFDAWRRAPGLPIVAVILTVLSSLTATSGRNALVQLAGFAIAIVNLGWLGTQLVWYQRAFDGERPGLRELLLLTSSFVARYFVLVCIPAVLVGVALVPLVIRWHSLPDLKSAGGRAGLLAFTAILFVIGTFIIPALAYTTRKVTKAISIGLAMLAKGWASNWMYVLVPAATSMALIGVGWLLPSTAQTPLVVLGALIYLGYTGAIARYYLRRAA